MKNILQIIVAFLVTLTVLSKLCAHEGIADEVDKELKDLRETYRWFAIVDSKDNLTNVKWISKPPKKIVSFLEKLIPIEVEISKKTKAGKFLYCVSSNGITTTSYQIRSNSIEIQGKTLQLPTVEEYLNAQPVHGRIE